MIRSRILILTVIMTAAAAAAFAQTESKADPEPAKPKDPSVSEIIASYVRALGGADKFSKVRSRTMRGEVELSPLNIKGTVVSYAAPEDKVASYLTINGLGDFAEGFDGTRGWAVNPLQGLRQKSAEEIARQRISANFFREINLEKLYTTLKFGGRTTIDGNENYIVEATAEGLGTDKLYFDVKTGLLSRYDTITVAPEGRFPTSTFIDDYRTVDGMQVSFRSRTKLPQYEVVIKLDEVKNNAEIDPKVFAAPEK
jgi:outer membrane lipoprotein-sorting protein